MTELVKKLVRNAEHGIRSTTEANFLEALELVTLVLVFVTCTFAIAPIG